MKIGINCGHTVSGQPGCGAIGYIDESVETRKVGNKLMLLLSKMGYTVYNCTNDYAPSTSSNLAQIVEMANTKPLDLFVSIHFNAGGGKGMEVYTYGGKQHTEAVSVCNALHGLGFVNRGIKDGSGLYVIKNTNAKAMLVEVCFVDNKSDVDLYKRIGADAIAAAIAEAITGQKIGTGGNTMAEFKDTKGHYAEKHINELKDMGVVNGFGDNEFHPDDTITRADAAIMVRNAIRYVTGK